MDLKNIQPKPAVCRQSSIVCALTCQRCWFYKYQLGVELRGVQIKEGASLGRIYHKFQQFGPGQESQVLSWIQKQQAVLMDRVEKGEDIDGSMVHLANLLTGLYHKAKVMANLFWERYPQPDYLQTVGTEIKISCPVDSRHFILEGTIDKLLMDTNTGHIWIRDHKSTSMSLEMIFGGLAWSIQARIYRILALEFLYPIGEWQNDNQVRGFIMDGILRPGIKLCRTDEKNAKDWNCSIEEAYLRRVKEWYKENDKEAILSKGILYTEPVYSKELYGVLDIMKDLFKRPIDLELFPRDVTRTTCFKYNSKCIYHDLCETSVSQWDQLFETKYRLRSNEDEEEQENPEV